MLVSFINGDPDQPIVVGSLYNGRNRPPYKLPEHKTRSTTKTNSSKGGKGYNEIRIEDKKGQEQMAVFAEKDIDNRVKHDRREHIGRDRHLVVEKDRFEQINNNLNIQVDGHRISETGKALHRQAGDSIHTRIGKDLYVEAGNEIHIKAGSKLVFDAGNSLTMNAGGSVMQTGAGGIGFNGATIRINAGGSPGSGSGASALDPEAPQEADKDYPGYKARLHSPTIKPIVSATPDKPLEFNEIPAETPPDQKYYFSVQLRDHNNQPLPGLPYTATLDDKTRRGSTNSQGFIEFELDEKPQKIAIDYHPIAANPDYTEHWEGEADSLSEDTHSHQRRLQQQGYYPGHTDGADMSKTSSAWQRFTRHQQRDSRDKARLNHPEPTTPPKSE